MPFPVSEFVRSGRFTDVQKIGQGAYGNVYRARDNMGRDVAVKEVLPSSQTAREAHIRFEKEARIQAQLDHPNIIRVYHLEKDSATGEWYLICEYANGGSLADYLAQHGKLSEGVAIQVALDICNALAEIWDRKIVHRDVKPSNILLTRNSNGETTAKLGDFGVAQDQQAARTTMAQGASHPGTPMYMAPEQSNSATILDARADIYALGITLWEMLAATDYKPLLGQNAHPDLRKYNKNASGRIAKVIAGAVHMERVHRYQTPQDMVRDLEAAKHKKNPKGVKAPRVASRPQEKYYTRRKWLWVLLVLFLLLGGGGIFTIMYGDTFGMPFAQIATTPTHTAVLATPISQPPATDEPVVPTFTPMPPFEAQDVCQVPDVVGLDQSAAEGLLTELRLQPSRSLQYDPDVPAGQVIAQNPVAGTRLEPCDGDVSLVISRGQEPTVTAIPTLVPTATLEPTPEPTETARPTPEPTTVTLPVISLDNAEQLEVLYDLEGHASIVEDMAFFPDSQTLVSIGCEEFNYSGCNLGAIMLWDVVDGTLIRTLNEHSYSVKSVAVSPDSQTIVSAHCEEYSRGCTEGGVMLWNVEDGTLDHTWMGHTDEVISIVFSPDGQILATASRDGTVKLWNAADNSLLHTLEGHSEGVTSIAFSPDGQTLASGSGWYRQDDNTVRLWNTADGSLIRTLEGHRAGVISVAFSPDGTRLASGSRDKTVKLWNVEDGRLFRTLSEHTVGVQSVAFSSDGQILATTAGGTVGLWDVADGMLIHTLGMPGSSNERVTFSPDGRLLVSAGLRVLKVWRVQP